MSAQSDFALEGRVEDSTGAAILSATVSIRSANGARRGSTDTDSRGAFRFEGLSAGEYVVTADAVGYAETEVWMTLPVSAPLAIRLAPGSRSPADLGIRLGILNMANESYATHLNAANPFTQMRIHEPGRAFYVGAEYGF